MSFSLLVLLWVFVEGLQGAFDDSSVLDIPEAEENRRIQSNDIEDRSNNIEEQSNNIEDRLQFYTSALFHDVQMSSIFKDSKDFVDAEPVKDIRSILEAYSVRTEPFSLEEFVNLNFRAPEPYHSPHLGVSGNYASESLESYLDRMLNNLTRSFRQAPPYSSLLSMPHDTIVPGGRFREWYYWDTLFPFMRKIRTAKKFSIGMLNNIQVLIEEFQFVPNGNRDYYLGRSQPPIVSMMVEKLFHVDPYEAVNYIGTLEKSLEFWTNEKFDPTTVKRLASHVPRRVTLPTGQKVSIYNSAWSGIPRPEAYKEDLTLSMSIENEETRSDFFRQVQASCESGWDFGSRFIGPCGELTCLETTRIAPVDLQSLIYHHAFVLGELHSFDNNTEKATEFRSIAKDIKETVLSLFWNEDLGAYSDYSILNGTTVNRISPAAVFPLLFRFAPEDRAQRTLETVKANLLKNGGIATSTIDSHNVQQWDGPLGWAPLQWFTHEAALNYGRPEFAQEIRKRWINMVTSVYDRTERVYEKYNVESLSEESAGEYGLQTGFAFTNAVTAMFLDLEKPNETIVISGDHQSAQEVA